LFHIVVEHSKTGMYNLDLSLLESKDNGDGVIFVQVSFCRLFSLLV